MISHQYKCIFIHIPKCGGTSIEVFLKKNAGALGHRKEEGLEYTMRREGLAKVINLYPQYFTFTFVRNPFDRFVSIWKHSERGKGYYFNRPKKNLNFNEYAHLIKEANLEQLSLFDKYHSRKQIEFILDYNKSCFFGVPRKTGVDCNFIGKYENLQDDFKRICQILKINNYKLPLEMISPEAKKIIRPHYSSYYDDETLAIVKDIYSEDIKYLGYKFEKKKYIFDVRSTLHLLYSKIIKKVGTAFGLWQRF